VTLPAPNLDDRGFQDLVDEAKRLVQLRNPTWTDHNVADPGVTLIETFAYMTDQLIYRLNRVPDLHYIKFLELLGEKMIPPGAATTRLEFLLSIAQEVDLVIPKGTLVSTPRTTPAPAVTFSTMHDLMIPTLSVAHVLTKQIEGPFEAHQEDRALRRSFEAFASIPETSDALYIGLSQPAPNCLVNIVFSGSPTIEGIGVDPLNPPYVVEAWDGQDWYPLRKRSDSTGGLNRDGTIEVYIPRHETSRVAGIPAGWLRVVVNEPIIDQPRYKVSPTIAAIDAEAVGGHVDARHCEPVVDEILGPCSGTPGDRLTLSHTPLIGGQGDLVIEVNGAHGWDTWHRVESFADSGPDDRHFTVDEVSGQIRFGPVIRTEDGGTRQYGATPPAQAMVRVPEYLVGGGTIGNVDAGTLTVMRSSIPYVSEVTNPVAANGGSDAETLDALKERAAITVRTQMRAVTTRDYELLVRLAAPSIARVSCVDATEMGRPGHVLVQVIPAIPEDVRDFELLQPHPDLLEEIRSFIEPRRPVGAVVHIEPPKYLGVSVAARLVVQPGATGRSVVENADEAIRRFLHPVMGGNDGRGWPFGHPLLLADVHSVLQRVPGVAYVDVVRLIPVDVVTGTRGAPADQIRPGARDLFFCVGNEFEIQ
jgi:predicted phage baseplate assembly protein